MDCSRSCFYHASESSNALCSFQSLYNLQQSGQFCDVVLEISAEHRILAHRVVLAASSPYFRAMFTSALLERAKKTVSVREFDRDIISAIVMHAYNASFSLPSDRVLTLLVAADFFQVLPLLQECTSFLQQRLNPDNCLGLRSIAGQCKLLPLYGSCQDFACEYFEEVMASGEYLSVPCDELIDLISSDDLRVSREEVVYSAVLRWVYHDFESRKEYFPAVMRYIRLPFVSSHFLSSIEQEILMQDEQCRGFIEEARVYKKTPEQRRLLRNSCRRIEPRKPFGLKDVILSVGRDTACKEVEQCDVKTNRCRVLSRMETGRYMHAACFLDGCLYITGGGLEEEVDHGIMLLGSVECYHVKENRWYSVAPMLQARM